MTSKLQRLIDLEIEQFIHEAPLPIKQEMERKQLRKDIEEKLGEEYTKHV